MNQSLAQANHSSVMDIQQNRYSRLLVVPLSCLLWGLSATGFALTAVSQEQSEAQPTETTIPSYSRVQDLLKQPMPKSGSDAQETEKIDFASYRLDAGDAIAVSISPRNKDLSFNATLDWQGNVSVPLVGLLSVKNLTLTQAQEKLRTALAEYLVNPKIGVVLGTARTVKITITGEIAKPGFYALQDPRLPVALIEAGGTTRSADLRSVQIRRASGSEQLVEQQFDLFTPLREGTPLPDLRLMDGDVVTIPTLAAGDRNEYDRELFAKSNVGQPKITVRVLDHSAGVSRLQIENGSDFLDALTSIKPEIERVNLKKVLLVRFNHKQGKAIVKEINARDALKGDPSQNPILEHNDVIVIDRTWIAKLNFTLNQITQPFKDALGFLLFFDSGLKGITNVFSPESKKSR